MGHLPLRGKRKNVVPNDSDFKLAALNVLEVQYIMTAINPLVGERWELRSREVCFARKMSTILKREQTYEILYIAPSAGPTSK
jgi:hypothetical protein